MIDIMRSFEFDAGHRVLGHEGKCANLHGHRYKAEIAFYTDGALDTLGRVIDFGVVKEVVGRWIDESWDHTMILNKNDPLLHTVNMLFKDNPPEANEANVDIRVEVFGPKAPFVLPNNPTAENMAKYLHAVASSLLAPHKIKVRMVKLWETPNCYALYMPDTEIPPAVKEAL